MKLLHISDLHLGKTLHGYSLEEEQEDILNKILAVVRDEKPQAVLIAGDVYDRPVPPASAVRLLDRFLTELVISGKEGNPSCRVFLISGNHDSADRVSFGAGLFEKSGVIIAPPFEGEVTSYEMEEDVVIHLLPFIKPMQVRKMMEEGEELALTDYEKALAYVIDRMNLDPSKTNVLVAHQFVTGAERSESEEVVVGGLDNIDGKIFAPFAYTALGHIHKPQDLKSNGGPIRYCGTPLKYSLSEANQEKSVTVVEFGGKAGDSKHAATVRCVPLVPLHDVVEYVGTFEEVIKQPMSEDFVYVKLKDEEFIPNVVEKLRGRFPRLTEVKYESANRRGEAELATVEEITEKTPKELFGELFEMMNDHPMNEEQEACFLSVLDRLREEDGGAK